MSVMSILAHSHCESLIKQITMAAKEFDVDRRSTTNWPSRQCYCTQLCFTVKCGRLNTEEKEILRPDDHLKTQWTRSAKRFYLFIRLWASRQVSQDTLFRYIWWLATANRIQTTTKRNILTIDADAPCIVQFMDISDAAPRLASWLLLHEPTAPDRKPSQ